MTREEKYNVLLINPPRTESLSKEYLATQIPMNIAYIASSLEEEGANVKIIDFCVEEYTNDYLLHVLNEFKPKIVGLTSMTPAIHFVEKISKTVKGHDNSILTLLGGIHISALPKRTIKENPYIDIGVVGEGEKIVKEIYRLKLLGKSVKGIKGTVCRVGKNIKINPRAELIRNLDDIPFPARHLLKMSKYRKSHVSRGLSRKHMRVMELSTSRGCPNQCIFCAGHINYGYTVRFRSYENIVYEIEMIIKEYNVNHISIADDTFTMNRILTEKLCHYFKKRKLTWNCDTRVNMVDLKLLKLMKESGCKKVSFGVESGSPRILKLIKKNITLDQIRNAFRWSRLSGIKYVESTFMLGSHPDEKIEDIEMTKKLIFELMPDFVSLSIISPFPGTESYRIMNNMGLLEKNPDWSRFTFINNKPPFKRLNNLTATQLMEAQRKILSKYYSSPKYIINQIKKIRTMNELMYFFNIGMHFVNDFLIGKGHEK